MFFYKIFVFRSMAYKTVFQDMLPHIHLASPIMIFHQYFVFQPDPKLALPFLEFTL